MRSERRLWQTIRDTMVLLCISIGLAPAFKMKFWNIGAEGQILIGGACSAAVMIYAGDKMPTGLLLIVMFVASALGGMIWGMIPAVFKANKAVRFQSILNVTSACDSKLCDDVQG